MPDKIPSWLELHTRILTQDFLKMLPQATKDGLYALFARVHEKDLTEIEQLQVLAEMHALLSTVQPAPLPAEHVDDSTPVPLAEARKIMLTHNRRFLGPDSFSSMGIEPLLPVSVPLPPRSVITRFAENGFSLRLMQSHVTDIHTHQTFLTNPWEIVTRAQDQRLSILDPNRSLLMQHMQEHHQQNSAWLRTCVPPIGWVFTQQLWKNREAPIEDYLSLAIAKLQTVCSTTHPLLEQAKIAEAEEFLDRVARKIFHTPDAALHSFVNLGIVQDHFPNLATVFFMIWQSIKADNIQAEAFETLTRERHGNTNSNHLIGLVSNGTTSRYEPLSFSLTHENPVNPPLILIYHWNPTPLQP